MTRSDQAFIEAYERSTTRGPASTPVSESGRHNTLHGPHAPFGAEPKLAESIAARMRQAAESMAPPTPDCVTQVESFRWPTVVELLAERHADDYLAACSGAVSLGRGNLIGLAGVHQGSGASTTVLAMARSLAAQHGPIAIVEADSAGVRLSTSLGVLKTRSLADALPAGGGLGEAAVYAAADRVSLLVSGTVAASHTKAARIEAAKLLRQHSLVLIDLGSLIDASGDLACQPLASAVDIFQPAGVMLVRSEEDFSGAVSAAGRAIESAGAVALGMVENLAPPRL